MSAGEEQDTTTGEDAPDADADTDADADGDNDTDGDGDGDTEPVSTDDPDTCEDNPCETPCVRFVDADAESPCNGHGWETALTTLQEGIASAADCAPCDVWVAAGTYRSFQDDPQDSFAMVPGVGLYGGFAGGETDLSQRDWLANPTVLDGRDGLNEGSASYHVVVGADDSILDGFTVTGGNAADPQEMTNQGGGMYNDGASPVVRNCIFSDNHSNQNGGGVMNRGDGTPVFEDCAFLGNSADRDGGGMGTTWGSIVTVERCVFSGNSAGRHGGGFMAYGTDSIVENCLFSGNTAEDWGGGIHLFTGDTTVASCVFAGNWAGERGGGAGNSSNEGRFVNCTFWDNGAGEGGGAVSNNDYIADAPLLSNCLLWGNYPDQIDDSLPAGFAEYSIVEAGWEGDGNLNADPLFVDSGAGDFRLQAGSPGIDSADGTVAPGVDFDGSGRVDDPGVPNTGLGPPWADIGAFEHQPD